MFAFKRKSQQFLIWLLCSHKNMNVFYSQLHWRFLRNSIVLHIIMHYLGICWMYVTVFGSLGLENVWILQLSYNSPTDKFYYEIWLRNVCIFLFFPPQDNQYREDKYFLVLRLWFLISRYFTQEKQFAVKFSYKLYSQ